MKTLIQDIVALTKEGWRLYDAAPVQAVYDRLGCTHAAKGSRSKPHWFVRDDEFMCVGCGKRCILKRPAGFPVPLSIRYRDVPREEPFTLTPQEMLARRNLLTVKQAAYCLNVSERTVYNLVAEGKLVRLKENPVRIRVDEVRAMCRDFDE